MTILRGFPPSQYIWNSINSCGTKSPPPIIKSNFLPIPKSTDEEELAKDREWQLDIQGGNHGCNNNNRDRFR